MLGIVQRVIASWLADQAGVPRDTAQCGVVTLIQRFGSALNLNVHVHMPWLDGVYEKTNEPPQRKPRLSTHTTSRDVSGRQPWHRQNGATTRSNGGFRATKNRPLGPVPV